MVPHATAAWRVLLACGLVLILGSASALAQPGTGIVAGPDTTRSDSTAPSGEFHRGGRDWHTPLGVLREVLARDHAMLRAFLDSLANTPLAIMRRNLAMNPRDWMPTEADRARREEDIRRSQGWDMIYRHNVPRIGVSVPLSSIGQALGLVEDVSPRISYTLLRTDSVSVRVYDLTSRLVGILVDGVQSPGEYRFDWDMNNSMGTRVAAGDYVAEVIVGKRLVLRKRIVVP